MARVSGEVRTISKSEISNKFKFSSSKLHLNRPVEELGGEH